MILTDKEIIGARVGAYAEEGLPVTDIMRYVDIEDRGIAKTQLKKVVEWGDEACSDKEHHPHYDHMLRRACPMCWQALLEEVNK